MQELQKEYLQSFPAKFSLWRKLAQEKDNATLELEFHKMKGTGKTYGAPEISLIAEQVERLLREGKTLGPALLESVIEMLQATADKYTSGSDFKLDQEKAFATLKSL